MEYNKSHQSNNIDRFEVISENYSSLMTEVFKEMGYNYAEMEETVLNAVEEIKGNDKTIPILDIGVGDGETTTPFLKAGYTNLTGLDLNPSMLEQARKKLGSAVKLVQGDALDLPFEKKQFPVIISGAAIHNIPKKDRKIFWKELLRLEPGLFAVFDKIADIDPEKQKKFYQEEIDALDKIYREKHGLIKEADEWISHCQYDQQEQMTIEELKENFASSYDMWVAADMGLYKTIVAKRKSEN